MNKKSVMAKADLARRAVGLDEINFINLPSVHQLRDHTGACFKSEHTLHRYEQAQWKIAQAQRQCAVIAAEILRPNDLYQARMQRQRAVEQARWEYENAAFAVFSETCTKGL